MTIIRYILYCIGALLLGGGASKEAFIGGGVLLFLVAVFIISGVLLSRKTEWPLGQCSIFAFFIVLGVILFACIICLVIEAL